jgi:hypothetical protein
VNPEANPIYKVLRSLWFPMSVNAVALGAGAVVLFRLVSLLAAWAFGFRGRAWEADSLFDDALVLLLRNGLSALPEVRALYGSLGLFFVHAAGAYFLWATFGVAMCRTLAIRIARDEYTSLGAAWRFGWKAKNTTLLWLPALALPLAFCAFVVAVAGLVGAIPYLGWVMNALLAPVTVLFVVAMQLVWCGGLVTMGFVPAAVAAERRGTYDAIGKAFHYLFARPLPTVLYLGVLWLFLYVIERAVFAPDVLRTAVVRLETFCLPQDVRLIPIINGDVDRLHGFAKACAWLHLLVFGGVDAIVRGAFLSWAAGGFTALFLMFRQECDGNDLGDVVKDPA